MKPMKKSTNEIQAELEAIINWFESEEVDIDQVASKYEQGLKLAAELKARLEETKNKITKLKASFGE